MEGLAQSLSFKQLNEKPFLGRSQNRRSAYRLKCQSHAARQRACCVIYKKGTFSKRKQATKGSMVWNKLLCQYRLSTFDLSVPERRQQRALKKGRKPYVGNAKPQLKWPTHASSQQTERGKSVWIRKDYVAITSSAVRRWDGNSYNYNEAERYGKRGGGVFLRDIGPSWCGGRIFSLLSEPIESS